MILSNLGHLGREEEEAGAGTKKMRRRSR